MATDAQSLVNGAACYNCGALGGQWQLYELGLLRLWLLKLNPVVATDAQTLLNLAACYDCGATGGQWELYKLGLLRLIAINGNPSVATDPQSLMNQAACYGCVSPGMWQLLELALLAQIANSPGGGGGNGILTGSFANPNGNVTPSNLGQSALYYQTDVGVGNQSLWQWNTTAHTWTQLI